MFSIPIHRQVGYTLQASKWQKFPMLIDLDEMKGLFAALDPFWIVQVSGLVKAGSEVVAHEEFLDVYGKYIDALKNGENYADMKMRSYFSSALTVFPEAFYAFEVKPNIHLVKVQEPVLQMQAHRFNYSTADSSFRSMSMGNDSISWGLQFSFPHIFQDAHFETFKVRDGDRFPNALLFKKLKGWMRGATIAAPIDVEGKIVNVPIRLGKNCLSWINVHPQLKSKGLRIAV